MTSAGDVRRTLARISTVWRVAYGPESRRRLAWSVVAVPRALAALPRAARGPRRVRALAAAVLAVPVALISSALTATLAFLVLINVLAYPFRGWLGLPGSTEDIWASRYADSWGGPTLAGAWGTHAGLILLLGVPAITWAVRGLTGLQWRLTGHRRAVAPPAVSADLPKNVAAVPPVVSASAPARVTVAPPVVSAPVPTRDPAAPLTATRPGSGQACGTADVSRAARKTGRVRWSGRRVGTVLAAVALLVTSSLTAHAAGIGDNLLWTPRDAVSTVALAVTLAPVAALLLISRTAWWRVGPRPR